MGTIEYDIDTHDLEDILQRKANYIGPYAIDFLHDIARDVERHVKRKAPHKTGKLKSSITHTVAGYGAVVYANEGIAPYVDWVIDGTRPHKICAKNKQALWWGEKGFGLVITPGGSGHFTGLEHPVKCVNHPGTKPNPFFEKGYEEAKDDMDKRTDKFVKWLIDL